ncbi:hypothetical protein F01_190055 [Burkholderia cenocepacia]|nr:hypothetical protein F01_190055 [Burkholderia cenocepacia]
MHGSNDCGQSSDERAGKLAVGNIDGYRDVRHLEPAANQRRQRAVHPHVGGCASCQ